MRGKSVFLLCVSVILLTSSCRKKDIPVPAYIHIPSVSLNVKIGEGTDRSGIEYVTVYQNDNAIGTFQVPCTFPIIGSGATRIDIRPRIKQLAREGLHLYSMLEPYSVTLDLKETQTDTVKPVFEYFDNREFTWLADFNNNVSSLVLKNSSIDTPRIENDPAESLDGTPYLYIPMGPGESSFELQSADIFNLPMDGRDLYLEIHYKSNVAFTIGTYASNSQQVVSIPSVSPFATGLEWKKGYVFLRDDVIGSTPDTRFRVFFRAYNAEVTDPKIYIDNIKLVYRKS